MEVSSVVKQLFDTDRADRTDKDWKDQEFANMLAMNDKERLERAIEIYEQVLSSDNAEDLYRLSFIFQHGRSVENYLKAHELAKKAMSLGHKLAPRMVANTYDRWMKHTTNPPRQKYGTQSLWNEDKKEFELLPVDPEVTDEERAKFDVPPLEELKKIAATYGKLLKMS